jgi:microcin C transport system substrate-binding protein
LLVDLGYWVQSLEPGLGSDVGLPDLLVKGSDNAMGVRDPAVDALVRSLLTSDSRTDLVAAARALDRVLRNGWYLVPHFYSATHRVAYRDTLAYPQTMPKFYAAAPWLLKTWWRKPGTGSD